MSPPFYDPDDLEEEDDFDEDLDDPDFLNEDETDPAYDGPRCAARRAAGRRRWSSCGRSTRWRCWSE